MFLSNAVDNPISAPNVEQRPRSSFGNPPSTLGKDQLERFVSGRAVQTVGFSAKGSSVFAESISGSRAVCVKVVGAHLLDEQSLIGGYSVNSESRSPKIIILGDTQEKGDFGVRENLICSVQIRNKNANLGDSHRSRISWPRLFQEALALALTGHYGQNVRRA